MVLVNSIVNACIELYFSLPKTGKPKPEEWTVISAVVGVFKDQNIKVFSLGTGSKCIGQSFLSPLGNVLNDSHAEVIARRAFIKYLYYEIIKLNEKNFSEVFYFINDDICVKSFAKFYFVTSMLPCGDASILPKSDGLDSEIYGECLRRMVQSEKVQDLKRTRSEDDLCSKKIKTHDANITKVSEKDIYRTGAKCLPQSTIQDPHLPGVLYHNIGVVRTKPGRGDPTLSLSCSDKIAKWNSIGWQGALLSLLIKTPIFMEEIVVGGGIPFSKNSFDRAVNERIKRKRFIPIHQSEMCFPDIKEEKKRPCPSTIIWCAHDQNKTEISVNGYKQGVTKKNLHKKASRTSICKKELFALFEKVVVSLPFKKKFLEEIKLPEEDLKCVSYGELKLKASEYQSKWETVKKDCFKVWVNKPRDLYKFTLQEE